MVIIGCGTCRLPDSVVCTDVCLRPHVEMLAYVLARLVPIMLVFIAYKASSFSYEPQDRYNACC